MVEEENETSMALEPVQEEKVHPSQIEDEREEDIDDSDVKILSKVIEPGIDVDTSRMKRFMPDSTTRIYYAESLFRNLVNRNVRTSNLDSRTINALRVLATVARSEQSLESAQNQTFFADIYNMVANLSPAGPSVGGTLLHLSRSKIAIQKNQPLPVEPEKKETSKWGFFGGKK